MLQGDQYELGMRSREHRRPPVTAEGSFLRAKTSCMLITYTDQTMCPLALLSLYLLLSHSGFHVYIKAVTHQAGGRSSRAIVECLLVQFLRHVGPHRCTKRIVKVKNRKRTENVVLILHHIT